MPYSVDTPSSRPPRVSTTTTGSASVRSPWHAGERGEDGDETREAEGERGLGAPDHFVYSIQAACSASTSTDFRH
jgi:hypothetical protein